jgi:hypothetical protein
LDENLQEVLYIFLVDVTNRNRRYFCQLFQFRFARLAWTAPT